MAKKVLKFSYLQTDILNAILCSHSASGMNIGEIRIVDKLLDDIKSSKSEKPEKPEQPKPEKEGGKVTPEQAKVFAEDMEKWGETMETLMDTPVDVGMDTTTFKFIQRKFQTFTGFQAAEESRKDLIKMAEILEV